MTWAQFPHDLAARMEGQGVSRDARLLMFESYLHCAEASTNGFVKVGLHRICDSPDPAAAADELLDSGFWENSEEGIFVPSFLINNLDANHVEYLRDEAALRKRRSRKHKAGDHSICIRGNYCPDGEIEHTSKRQAPFKVVKSRDGHVTVPMNQSKAKQVKDEAKALLPSSGATPDAPDGALGYAPKDTLVLSQDFGKVPHPYLIRDSLECEFCGKEKSSRHFNTHVTEIFETTINSLRRNKYTIAVDYQIFASDYSIGFTITATNQLSRIKYRTDAVSADNKLETTLRFDSVQVQRHTPPQIIDWELESWSKVDHWLEPVFWIVRKMGLDPMNQDDFCYALEHEQPCWNTKELIRPLEFSIWETEKTPEISAYTRGLPELIKKFIELPAPTENTSETSGETNA
jgi:hypothetical protein